MKWENMSGYEKGEFLWRRFWDVAPLTLGVLYVLTTMGLSSFVGILILVLSHELGHAMVASWMGIEWRFDIREGCVGVAVSVGDEDLPYIMFLSGGIINVLFLPVLLPTLSVELYWGVLIILVFSGSDLWKTYQRLRKHEEGTKE